MAIKNTRTRENPIPSEDKVPETARRNERKDALKRDILRVATHIRAGNGGLDEEGNDV